MGVPIHRALVASSDCRGGGAGKHQTAQRRLAGRKSLIISWRNRRMEEPDLSRPAIVFWMHQPGEITSFDRLRDAVLSVMQIPTAKTAPVAWIRTTDRNIEMDEIRAIALRFSLTWRLSQIAHAATDAADAIQSMERPRAKRFWWPAPPVPQS